MGKCYSRRCNEYFKLYSEESEEETIWILQDTRSKNEPSEKYVFEQKLLEDTVIKDSSVTKTTIISYRDAEVRATAPRDFMPNHKALKNIVSALKGDTSGLAEHGIELGSGTNTFTPGKVDTDKAIYATDGQGGGCTIFKSRTSVLIVVYNNSPAQATRLASEVAEYMEEQGH